MANVHEANFELTNALSLKRTRKKEVRKVNVMKWLYEKGIFHLLAGVMLGRAVVMLQFMPFALPFFAAVMIMQRQKAPQTFAGLTAGAAALGLLPALYTATILLMYYISFGLLRKYTGNQFVAAGLAAGVTALVKTLYTWAVQPLDWMTAFYILAEAAMTGVLLLIFLQSFLVLTKGRRSAFSHEELVALSVLAASIALGLTGLMAGDLVISHIAARYVVLAAALSAGALVGSTAGVVIGLLFCLASFAFIPEVALLAVAGLLGGLLKSGGRVGVVIGLMLATMLTGLMMENALRLEFSLYESAVAALLLFITPQSWVRALARHIPGSEEYAEEQQLYAKSVRDVTAEKVEHFSAMFKKLSDSFSDIEPAQENPGAADEMIGSVTKYTCDQCFRKEFCWSEHFDRTYEWMSVLAERGEPEPGWKSYCVKSALMEKEFDRYHQEKAVNQLMQQHMKEGNRFVARQLSGLADVMSEFANELQRETIQNGEQEEKILQELDAYGVRADQIDIHCLEAGRVDLDVLLPFQEKHGECDKLIAPMLSSILQETVIVHQKGDLPPPYYGTAATFRSAKAFQVTSGIAHAAYAGGLVSGDSCAAIPIHEGKFAAAICDGMGNGEKAREESEETIGLLEEMLKAGIEEELAIKSVNAILTAKRTSDMYSTVDLAMIDLQHARARFLKVGAVPSYVKRGKQIQMIEAANLPLGFFHEMEMDVLEHQLKSGDMLFMLSDGLIDGLRSIENPERWMRRQIAELVTTDPQEAADLLVEAAVRAAGGSINDDMTVVAVKIDHQVPKWAAIPLRRTAG
ncbi:stage II sporulation protein E [Jeotgalibacillus haloalkalitolerans]|uniref:Stage II sporulation protein E n=1 Tax=Jeotgalibacillus haloalkalitolerans TaxID=3104292 RepID=A0ABU5KSW1_9BACL|nr:stage II sporulation protein E [Jeotgalibacillus sp. HH7-29]MDZ5713805.1 stage II sporulation protein E [Jeotgalibacillus sp. HH7-29]